jgi:hypothetical protein
LVILQNKKITGLVNKFLLAVKYIKHYYQNLMKEINFLSETRKIS